MAMTYSNKAKLRELRAVILHHMKDSIDEGLITKEELEDILDIMEDKAKVVLSAAAAQWLEASAKEALREAISEVLAHRYIR
jgi:Glu-tRNA(Gln) amidotransferase subunit E-like FAD-binding protein